MGPSRAMCGYAKLCAVMWGYMELCGATWGHMQLYRAVWGHMQPYGATWGCVGPCAAVWSHVWPCRAIWACMCQSLSAHLHGQAWHMFPMAQKEALWVCTPLCRGLQRQRPAFIMSPTQHYVWQSQAPSLPSQTLSAPPGHRWADMRPQAVQVQLLGLRGAGGSRGVAVAHTRMTAVLARARAVGPVVSFGQPASHGHA